MVVEMGLRAAERASGASDAARGRIGHIKDEATGIAVPVASEERTATRPHSLKSYAKCSTPPPMFGKVAFFMAKDTRKRNWVFVVYPDSAPEGWRDILRGMLVPGYISPLHSADKNADGGEKKAHWHVLLTFHGSKSYEQVKEITDALNAPAPQVCKDVRAYARYLCHLDNPEKAQYEVADVESLGGADYLGSIKCAADTDTALGEMMDWCIEQGCYSFYRLSNYARANRPDWFRVITSSRTVFLTAWLKSMEWEAKNGGIE